MNDKPDDYIVSYNAVVDFGRINFILNNDYSYQSEFEKLMRCDVIDIVGLDYSQVLPPLTKVDHPKPVLIQHVQLHQDKRYTSINKADKTVTIKVAGFINPNAFQTGQIMLFAHNLEEGLFPIVFNKMRGMDDEEIDQLNALSIPQ